MEPIPKHVSIITGAGSGIGRAIAVELAGAGHALVLAGRRSEPLDETGLMLAEARWISVPTDVADPEQVNRLIARALDVFGRIDALVNNAGLGPVEPIERTEWQTLVRVFDINALGPAWAIARVWPIFVQQGGGCIVNISSMATVDPFPGLFAYAAAKGALSVMALSCVNEGREHGIRAFAVAPGAVETAMLRSIVSERDLPPEQCLDPSDVARVVAECIRGDREDQMGRTILVPSP